MGPGDHPRDGIVVAAVLTNVAKSVSSQKPKIDENGWDRVNHEHLGLLYKEK